MLKTIYTLFFGSMLMIGTQIFLSSSSNGRAFSANDGNTGAPNEGQTCRSCHGTGFGATVVIEFRNSRGTIVTSYIPGDVYELTVNVNSTPGPSRFGFQLVSLSPNNGAYNAWSNPSANTRIANASNGRSYAEHRGKSTTNSFKVDWTAPASGTGNIAFYAGGAAVNNNGNTSGDGGNTTSLIVTENVSTTIDENTYKIGFNISPNPVNDLLTVSNLSSKAFVGKLNIVNMLGSTLLTKEVMIGSLANYTTNLSDLEAGVYFIQWIEKTGQQRVQRFVKQ